MEIALTFWFTLVCCKMTENFIKISDITEHIYTLPSSKSASFLKVLKIYFPSVYLQFHFTIFCHFLGIFIIPTSQDFLYFSTKNYLRCFLQFSRNQNLIHKQFSVKTEQMVIQRYNFWSMRSENFLAKLLQFLPDHHRNMQSIICLMNTAPFF